MRLKLLREQRNIKQKELADAIGVSPSLVSKWEKGTRQLDLDTAYQISKFLQISIDELMEERKVETSSYNMDQVTLYDFKANRKIRYYLLELPYLLAVVLFYRLNILEYNDEITFTVVIGLIILLDRLYHLIFVPKKHIKYLMQSVNVDHKYVRNKAFNIGYHYTQKMIYHFIMFIFQILFVAFSSVIFEVTNQGFLITISALWFLGTFFLFGYLLILTTIKIYPETIQYDHTKYRFRDPYYQFLRVLVLLQNVFFFLVIFFYEIEHSLVDLTIVIIFAHQITLLMSHKHNTNYGANYEFNLQK